MEKTTVLIADDHQLIRESIALILQSSEAYSVVALCEDAPSAIRSSQLLKPQVILLDIHMPHMDGFEAIPILRKYNPGVKILGMSMHRQPAYARKMIRLGAAGYVTKNTSREELGFAIQEIICGRRYLGNEIRELVCATELTQQKDAPAYNALTERELQVIEHIVRGLNSKEIAEKMHIARKTVEVHRHNILKKLKLNNVAALVDFIHRQV